MTKSAQMKYAKLPAAFVQAIGLFRSLKPGERNQPLDVTYEAEDLKYRFTGPCLLGVDDMRVLLAVIAVACAQNPSLQLSLDGTDGDRYKKIKTLLAHSLEVRCTYDELAREIGYSVAGSGSDITIRNALGRLAATKVVVLPTGQCPRFFEAGPIIEPLVSTDASPLVAVRLCSILAFSVLGGPGTYMRVDLVEARKLKTDITRLIHFHLAWLPSKGLRSAGLEKLVSYVYANDSASIDTQRQRRRRVKAAIAEFSESLTWITTWNRDTCRFTRTSPRPRKPLS